MEKDKILLVSPDRTAHAALVEWLQARYEVCVASGFDEALAAFTNDTFYTVITGMDEGGNSPVEVIKKLQQANTQTPVIVITTHNSAAMAVDAMKAGEYDYITRPFNLDELKLVILHARERKKLQEEVKDKKFFQELSLVDGLTQVYNRRYFDELLQREEWRAKRYPQQFSLLMVDIDGLAACNDYYGRSSGDKVLARVGLILRGRIRNTDAVARYGGEEFAVITPHTDKQHAVILASRLLDAVAREEIPVDGNCKAKVTVSIGLATFNEDSYTKEELIKNADLALNQAKALGKNRLCLFGSAAQ